MRPEEPVQHLVGRIGEALAEDPRTHLLDLRVRIAGGRLFLLGQVPSPDLKRTAEAVAREMAPPGMTVVNELTVATYDEPGESEHL